VLKYFEKGFHIRSLKSQTPSAIDSRNFSRCLHANIDLQNAESAHRIRLRSRRWLIKHRGDLDLRYRVLPDEPWLQEMQRRKDVKAPARNGTSQLPQGLWFLIWEKRSSRKSSVFSNHSICLLADPKGTIIVTNRKAI